MKFWPCMLIEKLRVSEKSVPVLTEISLEILGLGAQFDLYPFGKLKCIVN